jgi:surfactin synthase thioesterase subunit
VTSAAHAIETQSAPWVTLTADDSAPVVLVCFHCAGASAQGFLPWRRDFTGLAELAAAEMPGHGRRFHEPRVDSISAAAEEFATSIDALPEKPIVFFGHSLGALLAYETTVLLRRIGRRQPRRLILSGRHAPDWRPVSTGLPGVSSEALIAYLRELGGTPEAVFASPAMIDMVLGMLAADLDLIRAYRFAPQVPLDMPIEVIGALADPLVSIETQMGWRAFTTRVCRLHMIDGGHFAIMARPDLLRVILAR